MLQSTHVTKQGGIATERIDKNAITCSVPISACEKAGMWGEALALLSSMATERIDMDTIT